MKNKRIEKDYTINFGAYNLNVTASNYSEHLLRFEKADKKWITISDYGLFNSVGELRKLAKGLNMIADEMDKDYDFNKK